MKHCAICHSADRYGSSAPPLIPLTLGKYGKMRVERIIAEGLPATNMPSYRGVIDTGGIKAIVDYLFTPAPPPVWTEREMLKTLRVVATPMDKPVHGHDLSNLFMVVEGGRGEVCIMEGKGFTLLDRVKVGRIHGGPKFDYTFHYAYMVSRDGWIVKYDLYGLKEIARIRAGINTRNIAVSDDGRLIAVANYLPAGIVLIDTESMKPIKTITGTGRIGAVYNMKGKGLFIALPRGRAEFFLIDYSQRGLKIKRVRIPVSFDDVFMEPRGRYLVGTSRDKDSMVVFDMLEGRVVREFHIDGMPHLASAALWKADNTVYAAIPHIRKPVLTIMRLYDWKVVKTVRLKGAGFFARTHRGTDYIWVDTNTDTIQLIDRKSLEVKKELVPEQGRKAMHIEFTKDGRYALISIWEKEGAVVIYDTETLKPVKVLPFSKPVGKYNATNKTHIL